MMAPASFMPISIASVRMAGLPGIEAHRKHDVSYPSDGKCDDEQHERHCCRKRPIQYGQDLLKDQTADHLDPRASNQPWGNERRCRENKDKGQPGENAWNCEWQHDTTERNEAIGSQICSRLFKNRVYLNNYAHHRKNHEGKKLLYKNDEHSCSVEQQLIWSINEAETDH